MSFKTYCIIYVIVLTIAMILQLGSGYTKRSIIYVAPVNNPFIVYTCNSETWRYFVKYATDCNVKASFSFNDTNYIIGREDL